MTTWVDFARSNFDFGDFFDAGADILWRDQAGHNVLWLMNNNTPDSLPGSIAALPTVTPDWHFKAAAAFDTIAPNPANPVNPVGEGPADILWQNDNGALALWQMEGTTVTSIHALPNPGPTWHVVGDNDFNGDLRDDILFRNDNGALVIWTGVSAATGTVSGMFAGTQNPGPAWHVVGTGDTDFDIQAGSSFRAGVLWQNDNGALALWEDPTFAAGTFTFNTVAALPTVDSSWHVKGMADLSDNNEADIVFQNDNGAVVVWEMNGTTIAAMNLVNLNPGPAWHIAGLRYMDRGVGGAQADILFQNDNGAAAIWEDYQSLGGGSATFNTVLPITPNPNPNGLVWDLL